jgi:hypothetical protein
MKISDLNSSGVGETSSQPIAPSSSRSAYGIGARQAYQSGPDQVYLSNASAIASSSLSSHSIQLAHLKSLVASGSYDPPASEISKSLLQESLARSGS